MQNPNEQTEKKIPHILIGIGAYDWTMTVHTEISLVKAIRECGVEVSVQYGMNDGIARTRNNLAWEFLQNKQYDYLLFIDSDIQFEPWHIKRLIEHDKDIVCGMYPKKQGKLCWVMNPLDPNSCADKETGLWEMMEAGTGLMLIKRSALESIIAKYPERNYKGDPTPDAERFDFFPMHAKGGRYLSEDWYFCHMARDAGIRIWMDTKIQARHLGKFLYPMAATLTDDECVDIIHRRYEIDQDLITAFIAKHTKKPFSLKPKKPTIQEHVEGGPLSVDLQGWNSDHPAFARLIAEVKPLTIVELGSWKGASAVNMAKLAPSSKVICVDTWLGGIDHLLNEHLPQNKIPRVDGWPQLYHQFKYNVNACGMAERIRAIPQSTANGLRLLESEKCVADLIYIDASHEYEDVFLDIRLAWKLLRQGGVMFGDDFQMEGVGPAVVRFCAENRLAVEIDGPFWILRK